MKISIRTRIAGLVLMLFLLPAMAGAIELSEIETRLMNDISRYIDVKPEGQTLKFFEHAMRSNSVALRGLAAIIMTRHYGQRFQGLLLRSFTLNTENDSFAQEKKVLVRLENIDRLLKSFAPLLQKLDDERVQQLFLFFHFRHKNVWLLGKTGEELSLASFYRISVFSRFFGARTDVMKLAALADLKK